VTHYEVINHRAIKKLIKLEAMYISIFLLEKELCWNNTVIVKDGMVWNTDLTGFNVPVLSIYDVFKSYASEVAGVNNGPF
jgi:hypothetical protein